ncbi:MAG: hypothetical protein HQM02_08105, partial [Magnetococcales bacterium]|nr:hypothetical protein [Magnetococcales bacterium]
MEPAKKTIQLKAKRIQTGLLPVEVVPPWRILVVDDEPDVIAITQLNLRNFTFGGRPLELVPATSG